jgi:hypothetical protein
MDLLGRLGETRNNAQPPNPTGDRGSSGGQTPSLLLAWLSAPPTQREEVVRETGALADGLQPEPPAQRFGVPSEELRNIVSIRYLKMDFKPL